MRRRPGPQAATGRSPRPAALRPFGPEPGRSVGHRSAAHHAGPVPPASGPVPHPGAGQHRRPGAGAGCDRSRTHATVHPTAPAAAAPTCAVHCDVAIAPFPPPSSVQHGYGATLDKIRLEPGVTRDRLWKTGWVGTTPDQEAAVVAEPEDDAEPDLDVESVVDLDSDPGLGLPFELDSDFSFEPESDLSFTPKSSPLLARLSLR